MTSNPFSTADGDAPDGGPLAAEAKLANDLLAVFPPPAAAPPHAPEAGVPPGGGGPGGDPTDAEGFNNCPFLDAAGMTEVLRHLAAQVRFAGLGFRVLGASRCR